jgi:hypothetical protein
VAVVTCFDAASLCKRFELAENHLGQLAPGCRCALPKWQEQSQPWGPTLRPVFFENPSGFLRGAQSRSDPEFEGLTIGEDLEIGISQAEMANLEIDFWSKIGSSKAEMAEIRTFLTKVEIIF